MIIYKDILDKLKEAGYNTNRIRKDKIISEGTLQSIRAGQFVNLKTIDTICRLTGLKIEDLIEYVDDEKTQKNV